VDLCYAALVQGLELVRTDAFQAMVAVCRIVKSFHVA